MCVLGGVCAMGRTFACCGVQGVFACCGVQPARVMIVMSMRYRSNGLWGVHAIGWWGGKSGVQGNVYSGVQCLLAMGCRMLIQWDMVSLWNKGCGVHPVGFGPHMQQGTEVCPAGSRVCVLWGRSCPCNQARDACLMGHRGVCAMGCLHDGAWRCMCRGYQMPMQWGTSMCVQ